jgi:hypothetical protein
MFQDNFGSNPVLSFPSVNPIVLPTPGIFDNTAFNNAATPVASYTGFWTVDAADSRFAPFVPASMAAISNIGTFANPLSTALLQVWNDAGGFPKVFTFWSPSGVGPVLADGITTYLEPGVFSTASLFATAVGDVRFVPHRSLGGPPITGTALAVAAPFMTAHLHISSC